jgi:hypothetical protein
VRLLTKRMWGLKGQGEDFPASVILSGRVGTTTGTGSEKSTTIPSVEWLWDALRTFLRPFCGASKHHLHQYAAVLQWVDNITVAVPGLVRVRPGLPTTTRVTL